MSHRKDRVRVMQDKEKETLSWNPPEPPWKPEPEPLDLSKDNRESVVQEASKESGDVMPVVEPVNMGLKEKIEEMVGDEDLSLEDVLVEDVSKEGGIVQVQAETIDFPGIAEYVVKCSTGITINGKLFAAGPHLVDEGTYETLYTLDAPYQ